MKTIRETISQATEMLLQAGVPDPAIDATLLLSEVVGMSKLEMKMNALQELTQEQEQRFSSLLLLRTQREPLQYLVGMQCFYGLDFAVDPRVLIPRQETETLCELAIGHLQTLSKGRALDLCTGSGALAVTMAKYCPHIAVTATDLSEDALTVAKQNALLNATKISFVQGDLFESVQRCRFDVIVSNPPYIPTKDCEELQQEVQKEPLMALDGGADGLLFYRRIAKEVSAYLAPNGYLLMEVGDHQAEEVCALLRQENCYAQISIIKDLYGLSRIVSAYLKS